jgi:hypothetical protein
MKMTAFSPSRQQLIPGQQRISAQQPGIVDLDNIPARLRRLPRWVLVKREWRKDPETGEFVERETYIAFRSGRQCGPTIDPCDLDADGTFRVDQIQAPDRDEAERLRAAVIAVLVQQPPIVVHDCDDELEMARWCEALWPSEKTTTIRQRIELERAAPGGGA